MQRGNDQISRRKNGSVYGRNPKPGRTNDVLSPYPCNNECDEYGRYPEAGKTKNVIAIGTRAADCETNGG